MEQHAIDFAEWILKDHYIYSCKYYKFQTGELVEMKQLYQNYYNYLIDEQKREKLLKTL